MLNSSLGKPCICSFGTIRTNDNNTVTTYAECTNPKHPIRYRILYHMKDEGYIFTVTSTKCDDCDHSDIKKFKPLMKEERQKVTKLVMDIGAENYLRQISNSIDPEKKAEGDMQNLRNLCVFQKLPSEFHCKGRKFLPEGEFSELLNLKLLEAEKADPFIRRVIDPFTVYLYTSRQFRAVIDWANKNKKQPLIVHFDGTGGIVRKPRELQSKRIYNYDLVVRLRESILVIAELITSEHDQLSISTFFKYYRDFVEDHTPWPFFKIICTDWSWALMNSIFESWNNTNVTQYLHHLYDVCTTTTKFNRKWVLLISCNSHFAKRIVKNMYEKFQIDKEEKTMKQFIMNSMSLMIISRDIKDIDEIFIDFVTVLLTPDLKKS